MTYGSTDKAAGCSASKRPYPGSFFSRRERAARTTYKNKGDDNDEQ
jgi:hypothetical protein